MTLIVIIVLCTFLINKIQNAPSPNMHYEIDEFIEQLMTSEKFSDLADVIAERAARKMKTAENSSNLTTLRHSYASDRSRKAKSNKEVQTHAQEDPVVKEKKKEEETSVKFGKINTKAFLEHDDASQELHLKYKHITKKLNDEEKKIDGAIKGNKNSERDDDNSEHSTEQRHKRKEKTANRESKERKHTKTKNRNNDRKHSSTSNEKHSDREKDFNNHKAIKKIKDHKSSLEFSDEDKTREISKEDRKPDKKYKKNTHQTTKKNIDDNSLDWSNYESKKDGVDHSEHPKESQEHRSRDYKRTQEATKEDGGHKSDDQPEEQSTPQTTKTTNEDTSFDWSDLEKKDNTDPPVQNKDIIEHDSHYSSKEVVEIGLNRAINDDAMSLEHKEKLDNVDSKEKLETKTPIARKQIVRRENGKLYTYLSSSDYDEYHEKIAQHQSRNNFINTVVN